MGTHQTLGSDSISLTPPPPAPLKTLSKIKAHFVCVCARWSKWYGAISFCKFNDHLASWLPSTLLHTDRGNCGGLKWIKKVQFDLKGVSSKDAINHDGWRAYIPVFTNWRRRDNDQWLWKVRIYIAACISAKTRTLSQQQHDTHISS